MNKAEIIKKLKKLGIVHDPLANSATLQGLLDTHTASGVANVDDDEPKGDDQGIVVRDPQVLVPKELPLVVVLGKDASGAQIEYAKVLNAYAYQNPEKWNKKKDALIKTLRSYKGLDALPNPDPMLKVGRKLPA